MTLQLHNDVTNRLELKRRGRKRPVMHTINLSRRGGYWMESLKNLFRNVVLSNCCEKHLLSCGNVLSSYASIVLIEYSLFFLFNFILIKR